MRGIKGDIVDGWTFDVFAAYDDSLHNQIMHDAVLKSRVQTLLNAPDGGASICAGGFDPFGDTNARSLSPACVNYMTKDTLSQENLTQTSVPGADQRQAVRSRSRSGADRIRRRLAQEHLCVLTGRGHHGSQWVGTRC